MKNICKSLQDILRGTERTVQIKGIYINPSAGFYGFKWHSDGAEIIPAKRYIEVRISLESEGIQTQVTVREIQEGRGNGWGVFTPEEIRNLYKTLGKTYTVRAHTPEGLVRKILEKS